tara:strand:+ start:1641 stop:2423 length:783 start_codon:yes stop_codon:yes gene_type:complete
MARKSQAVRIAEAKETLTAYTSAGLETMTQARFVADMIRRMERGKYPTKRQRDWLDRIIEEGVPAPKGDLEYIAKIDAAITTEGFDFSHVLKDFRGKLVRGWDLSEKQKSWCDSLIEKAEAIRNGNHWQPDDATTERIKKAVSVAICYNQNYWYTHSGGEKAMTKAKQWLSGDLKFIDEWTVNKLFKTVAGRLREMENPKFEMGAMGYVPWKQIDDTGRRCITRKPGIIVAGPIPTRSGVAYDILVNGEVITSSNISKRR